MSDVFRVTISGSEVAHDEGTLTWEDQLNGRSAISFTLTLPIGAARPQGDAPVQLLDPDDVVIFAGLLEDPAEELLFGTATASDRVVYSCAATSNDAIADRRLVAAAYDAQPFATIIGDLVTSVLASDGVTVGTIESGPTITITFNYKYANECLNELCDLAGKTWWIDQDNALQVRSRASLTAPFTLTDAAPNCESIKISRPSTTYRNLQYIRAATDLTTSRTESFKGDGATKTFLLGYPVGAVPTAITVDSVAKTLGIRSVDTGLDWYWNKDSNEITQDDGATALTSSNTLAVTYRGAFPILVSARREDAISTRRAITGGSGLVEMIEDDTNIDTGVAALDKASAYLARYGQIDVVLTILTEKPGLRAGHLLPVTLSAHDLNGEFLVESVRASERTYRGDKLLYEVRALSGVGVGGWLRFYQTLLAARRSFVVRDNEVLLILRTALDALTLGDSTLTVTSGGAETRVGYGLVGFAEVG